MRFHSGPRRQGFAAPLRALDRSGPLRRPIWISGKGGLRPRAAHVSLPLVAPESSYNELTVLATEQKAPEVFPLAARGVSGRGGSLPETRVRGLPAGNHAGVGGCWPVTSTLVWGCGYSCDGTASVSLDQRYYASSYGRFTSPDRYQGSAGPMVPLSWNRYAYVLGDPVNATDRTGTHLDCDDDSCDESDCDGDPISCMMAGQNGGGGGGACDSVAAAVGCGDPVIATATACATPGQQFINGMCDVPIYQSPLVTGIFSQVGTNLQGADALLAAGSASAATFAIGAAVSTLTATAATSVLGNVPASAFAGGTPSFQIATDEIVVSRVTSTATDVAGNWTTTEAITSGSQATSVLALPASNSASFITTATIPAGAGYFTGIAAPLFGQIGGGVQIWGAPVVWGLTRVLPPR